MFANMDMKKFIRTIIDTMLEGLMLIDPGGQIIFTNKALENLLGYSAEELKGKKIDLFQEEPAGDNRFIYTRKDGSPIHLLKNQSAVRDKHQTVLGAIITLTDISETVSLEKALAEIRIRQRPDQQNDGFPDITGTSSAVMDMIDLSRSAARSEAPILLQGESGTGKSLLAKAIHAISPRKEQPYIEINCTALNENLLEAELFGQVKGAFPGADFSKRGKFETAGDGTVFLDEIGDLPLGTQAKLLRVLQDLEIERLGDLQPIKINARVIASTHKDLRKLIRDGQFREDLYYRINVIPIPVPSLQERVSDIPLLVEHFIGTLAQRTGKQIDSISREALETLMSHSWPGNIRELINVLEYGFVLCTDTRLGMSHLPVNLLEPGNPTAPRITSDSSRRRQQEIQKKQLLDALHAADGNQTRAAEILGISRVTVWKRMKKFNVRS